MSENSTSQIYVTKYALTTGVFVANAEVLENGNAFVPTQRDESGKLISYAAHFCWDDFQLSRDQAEARFVVMRDKKIKSLERQIEKLKSLKFTVKGET